MKNILLINGHQRAEIAKGELNRSLIDLARSHLENRGCTVKSTKVDDGYTPSLARRVHSANPIQVISVIDAILRRRQRRNQQHSEQGR